MLQTGQAAALENLLHESFLIPDYQRPYAWSEKEAVQLLHDLDEYDIDRKKHPYNTEPYLLNSMLLRANGERYEVIDGQQRLTTAFLVISALRRKLPLEEVDWKDYLDLRLKRTVIHDGSPRREALLRDQDPDVQKVLDVLADANSEVPVVEESSAAHGLLETYSAIERWISGLFEEDFGSRWSHFMQTLLQHTRMIPIVVQDEARAWQVFQRANDRGKRLTNTDLLKSDLFQSTSPENRAETLRYWNKMMATLRHAKVDNEIFLHHYALAKVSGSKIGKGATREVLQKHVANPVRLAKDLSEASEVYVNLIKGVSPSGNKIPSLSNLVQVGRLARFRQSRWFLLSASHLPEEAFALTADLMERMAFFVTLTSIRGQDYEKNLFDWSKSLRSCQTKADVEKLIEESIQPRLTELFAEDFSQVIFNANRDNLGEELTRYILGKMEQQFRLDGRGERVTFGVMEQYGTKGCGVDVEHIMPQNPTLEALREFNEKSPLKRLEYTSSLANLILLERAINRSIKNEPFSVKVQKYRGSGYMQVKAFAGTERLGINTEFDRFMSSWKPYETWTPADLERRKRELLRACCKIWDLGERDAAYRAFVVAALPQVTLERVKEALGLLQIGGGSSVDLHKRSAGKMGKRTLDLALEGASVLGLAERVEGLWGLTLAGEEAVTDLDEHVPRAVRNSTAIQAVALSDEETQNKITANAGYTGTTAEARLDCAMAWWKQAQEALGKPEEE